MESGLYLGTVMHERSFPKRHRLKYGVWYLLADLDELDLLDRTVPGFGVDRAAPVSFHQADHGDARRFAAAPVDRGAAGRRPASTSKAGRSGSSRSPGSSATRSTRSRSGSATDPTAICARSCTRSPTRSASGTTTSCRSLPATWSTTAAGAACARSSTSGCSSRRSSTWPRPTTSPRACPTSGSPSWCGRPRPAAGCSVATLGARRRPLTGRSLAAVLLRYPFVTLKVIGGIHWEALKLWRKGAPYRRRGTPPASPMTVVGPHARPEPEPSEIRHRPGYARPMSGSGRRRRATDPRHRRSSRPGRPCRPHAARGLASRLRRRRRRAERQRRAASVAAVAAGRDDRRDRSRRRLRARRLRRRRPRGLPRVVRPASRAPSTERRSPHGSIGSGAGHGARRATPRGLADRSPTSCSTTTSATTSTRPGSTRR